MAPTTTATTSTTATTQIQRYTADELEGFSKRCVEISYLVVLLLIVLPLIILGYFEWGLAIMFLGIIVRVMARVIIKCNKKGIVGLVETPSPYQRNQPGQTPTPHAQYPTRLPPPSLHIPSRSLPPRPSQVRPPPISTNDPNSRSSVSLSTQLSQAYYSHASNFSSPFIASQARDRRNSNSSTWPSSLFSPSVPSYPVHNSSSSFTDFLEMEAARRHAASLQPPEYPEAVQDSPELPPPVYTIPTTDETSVGVFGPSSDGLPSYEAAMSTWQPPADERHPTLRDDPPRTND